MYFNTNLFENQMLWKTYFCIGPSATLHPDTLGIFFQFFVQEYWKADFSSGTSKTTYPKKGKSGCLSLLVPNKFIGYLRTKTQQDKGFWLGHCIFVKSLWIKSSRKSWLKQIFFDPILIEISKNLSEWLYSTFPAQRLNLNFWVCWDMDDNFRFIWIRAKVQGTSCERYIWGDERGIGGDKVIFILYLPSIFVNPHNKILHLGINHVDFEGQAKSWESEALLKKSQGIQIRLEVSCEYPESMLKSYWTVMGNFIYFFL